MKKPASQEPKLGPFESTTEPVPLLWQSEKPAHPRHPTHVITEEQSRKKKSPRPKAYRAPVIDAPKEEAAQHAVTIGSSLEPFFAGAGMTQAAGEFYASFLDRLVDRIDVLTDEEIKTRLKSFQQAPNLSLTKEFQKNGIDFDADILPPLKN